MPPSKLEAFTGEIAAWRLEADRLLVDPADGPPITLAVQDLVHATIDPAGGLRLALADGRVIPTHARVTLQDLAARLAAHPGFVRVQLGRLLNLDYVDTAAWASSGEHRLTLFDGQAIPLTMSEERVMAYFGVESLDHVIPWNERHAAIVKEGLRAFEQDIRFMNEPTIRANFSTKTTGELVRRQLVGNIIWQAYTWIAAGRLEPLDGNIRSFWYSHIKPVLGRFYPLSDQLYKELTDILADYVGDHHLFRYADFGLVDDSGNTWLVGPTHPHIVFCAEKNGHWRALQQVQQETGVTAIALGGQPSLMTTEGLVDALARGGLDLGRPLHLVTDVDYDPSGNSIAGSFIRQLGQMGVKGEVTRFDLVQPENFTPEEIQAFRYPVPQNTPEDRKKTANWLDKTKSPFGGGLPGPDGQPVPDGLESDAMPRKRLHDLAVAAIEELKQAPLTEAWTITAARIASHRPPLANTWGTRSLPP